MKLWPLALLVLPGLGVFAACGSAGHSTGFGVDDGGGGGPTDGTFGGDHALVGGDGGVLGSGDSGARSCDPTSDNQQGCRCPSVGATQACYTGPANTRNVGTCKDGTQTCSGVVEDPQWGPCTGAVVPTTGNEPCDGKVDTNCNGKVGCADPTCTTTPICNMGCTTGQTRPCYTGPSGTENVGACKDGTQTCSNNTWGACTGQVLPQLNEDCCSPADLNCNGLAGCYDLFACITSTCCQGSCDAGAVDPGCTCATGSGDTQTCPKGDHYVHKGPVLPPGAGTDECCPCTPSTCSDNNCCNESVCAGNSACSGLTCKPLPASCKGQVNTDCDDFPEDCDEPCCECTQGCP